MPPERSRRAGTVAAAVPPVASTSSTISTRSPGWMASRWISSLSVPYSSSYSSRATAHGSLPGLAHRDEAGADPVGDRRGEDEAAGLDADHPVDRRRRRSGRRARRSRRGTRSASPSSGVMSRNVTPGCGKSGMSRTSSRASHVSRHRSGYSCGHAARGPRSAAQRRFFLRGRGGWRAQRRSAR